MPEIQLLSPAVFPPVCLSWPRVLPLSIISASIYQAECSVPARDLHQVSHGIDESGKFIIGGRIACFLATHRPVNHQWPANDVLLGYEAPVPTVGAVVAVITHHKVVALRNNQLIVLNHLSHPLPPCTAQTCRQKIQARKLVAERIMRPEIVDIPFYHRRAVYIDLLIDQADVISGNSDHSLYEVQPGIEWIVKNDNIPAFYLAIRQKLARKVAGTEVQFIH